MPGSGQSGRGGRGRRRGWGQRAIFLRPGILLLLRQDPSHGYTLIEDLRQEGIIDEDVDPAIVYRHLRDMEEEGLLHSEWQTESSSVPRRVYQLTPAGEAFVRGCMANLRGTERRLGNIFRLHREQFPDGT